MDALTQWFLSLFSAMEMRAFIWLILATLAFTHTAKIAWRYSPLKGGGHAQIALISAVAGMCLAYFIWPPIGSGPFWVVGLVAGPASNIAFKLGFGILKRYMPDLAATVNLDRRKDMMPIPPVGSPERRK